ncbi:MAG: class I SAM-dependent methyltransferase [Bacteroidetes bacterium]|nr:class I SAM-dependent methyltransferase [Bacteroidota bacterium]
MSIKELIKQYSDNSCNSSFSYLLRKKRLDLCVKILDVNAFTNILDVGGTEHIWIGTGFESNVTILNVNIVKKVIPFKYVNCNACNMESLEDKSYDLVFSNSVIEHVGDIKHQKMFANEIVRVGKKCWVQTPNKYFPIEPHFIFPLFQFMPKNVQRYIGMNWKYSHLKRNGENIIDELQRLRLLTKVELQMLFPEFTIYEEKYYGMTKSLIAYYK